MKRIWVLSIVAVGWSQDPPRVAPLHFDVASVKEVQTQSLSPRRFTEYPGRLKAESVSIDDLIAYAYGVQPAQIVGLKSGLGIYDVEGKADGAYSQKELRAMLQGLLNNRFRLEFHREERDLPAEILVASKDLKLKAARLPEADPRGFKLGASGRGAGSVKATSTGISLAWLADYLSSHLSKLVVDGTELKGFYEFDVDVAFDLSEAMDERVPAHDATNLIRLGLVSALGLKLESTKKARVQVLVIDRVIRPEPN
ncbi:MAG: TIGR03435 family protein [Candidatus Solibacter sp.]